jgi:hypothetical protein
LIYLQDKITKVTADHLRNTSTDIGLLALSEIDEISLSREEFKEGEELSLSEIYLQR